MIVVGVLIGLSGLLLAVLGYPLWKRTIPPNGIYGFRIPATLADEYVWYEVNARSGLHFMLLGSIVTAAPPCSRSSRATASSMSTRC